MIYDSFDFGDGNGVVNAHRHRNPDGSIGGWVADTAEVERKVYIESTASVYGRARVLDKARICGLSRVFESAQIYGEANVFGNAIVRGYAKVSGFARIGGIVCILDTASVYGDANITRMRSREYLWLFVGECANIYDEKSYQTWLKMEKLSKVHERCR